jgi:hypothetical protein
MTRRLCIFAHFDAQNEVKPFIAHYVRKLREDCDDLVFVSVSQLPESEQQKLRPSARSIYLKENEGYDFGMWKHALERVDVSSYDELVLANSSVFGPLGSLGPIFQKMSEDSCDVWAMTDNTEIDWHLQSYFLVFKRKVLLSDEFKRFWTAVLPYKSKDQVIRSYEVGMSVYLKERGFLLKPFARMSDLPRVGLRDSLLRKKRRSNPTCAYPLSLIAAGMPLVKVELFRDNPLRVDLKPVRKAVEAAGFDMAQLVYDRPRKPQATKRDSTLGLPPETPCPKSKYPRARPRRPRQQPSSARRSSAGSRSERAPSSSRWWSSAG